jgi:hypothetical protein
VYIILNGVCDPITLTFFKGDFKMAPGNDVPRNAPKAAPKPAKPVKKEKDK